MTKYSQKWTIVSFLDQIMPGTCYHMTEWPMHVTLAGVFAIDENIRAVSHDIAVLAAKTKQVIVTATDNTILGIPESPVDVTLLEKCDELIELHSSIIQLLEKHGARFNSPEYNKRDYLPHITVRNKEFLPPNHKIEINTISLVDMFPDDDWRQRKVIYSYALSNLNIL